MSLDVRAGGKGGVYSPNSQDVEQAEHPEPQPGEERRLCPRPELLRYSSPAPEAATFPDFFVVGGEALTDTVAEDVVSLAAPGDELHWKVSGCRFDCWIAAAVDQVVQDGRIAADGGTVDWIGSIQKSHDLLVVLSTVDWPLLHKLRGNTVAPVGLEDEIQDYWHQL